MPGSMVTALPGWNPAMSRDVGIVHGEADAVTEAVHVEEPVLRALTARAAGPQS
jgi:hypothetical protein